MRLLYLDWKVSLALLVIRCVTFYGAIFSIYCAPAGRFSLSVIKTVSLLQNRASYLLIKISKLGPKRNYRKNVFAENRRVFPCPAFSNPFLCYSACLRFHTLPLS